MLQNVFLLGLLGLRYIDLIYKSDWLPQSFLWERTVFIQGNGDIPTWPKLNCNEDIPNAVLIELLLAALCAHGGRLLASVQWVLC